jgi:cysteine sulfinate desulfinase/cysteine desulfurase-like protein
MGDPKAAASSVRFSLGEETTSRDVEAVLSAAARVLAR